MARRMSTVTYRTALRSIRRFLGRMEESWRSLVVGALIGILGALAVAAFRTLLIALEEVFVGAHDGYLVAAADRLAPEARFLAPAVGSLAAGVLLWLAQRDSPLPAVPHGGDYIEAVVIGQGRLDLRGGILKVLASLLVVSTGGAVGREGAMVLLAAMGASAVGRVLGRAVNLRLVVSCGAAAGLAAAYHAPLAGAVFVAEILLGSLALSQLGPVIVAAVMAYDTSMILGEPAILFPLAAVPAISAFQVVLMVALSLVGGLVGAGLLRWLRAARRAFEWFALPLPLTFALGGLAVGGLSLLRPEVWGNGYSGIAQQLNAPGAWQVIALILGLKLLAVGATTGSGAPGGVFTPTLFVGATFGALIAAALARFGVTQVVEPGYAVLGMAMLLAATTHAPVMAALMVVEMTGQYGLLPVLLPACVLATVVSQRLNRESVYGLTKHTAIQISG